MGWSWLSLTLSIVLSLVVSSAADKGVNFFSGKRVLEIHTSQQFIGIVLKSEWTLVQFYNTGCEACAELNAEFDSAAAELGREVLLVKVDLSRPALAKLGERFRVEKNPELLIFRPGPLHPWSYTGKYDSAGIVEHMRKFKTSPEATQAPHRRIKNWDHEPAGSHVEVLEPGEIVPQIEHHAVCMVMLYWKNCIKCREHAPDFTRASEILHGYGSGGVLAKMDVTAIKNEPHIQKYLKTSSLPVILVFKRDVRLPFSFTKPVTIGNLVAQMKELLPSIPSVPKVHEFSNFALEKNRAQHKAMLVYLYDERCDLTTLGPVFEEVAERLQDIALVGRINVGKEMNAVVATEYGDGSLPTVVIFSENEEWFIFRRGKSSTADDLVAMMTTSQKQKPLEGLQKHMFQSSHKAFQNLAGDIAKQVKSAMAGARAATENQPKAVHTANQKSVPTQHDEL